MGTRQTTRVDAPTTPPEFRDAVARMRAARLRPEVLCEEMPAPQRIAPHAAELSADVTVDGEDLGTGRIVLLHDPAGNDTWSGTFRCVAYARAEIKQAGFDVLESPTAILPIIVHDTAKAIAMSKRLLELGVWVVAFGYPVVPQGKARLRVQVSAALEPQHIQKALDAFSKL